MAKLNVVIPANEVEIDGVKFRKVDRSVKAGDIVRIVDEDTPSYVTYNAFYKVDQADRFGDPHIIDEDGDDFDLHGYDYEVFEPIAKPAEVKPGKVADVGQRIKIVNAFGTQGKYKNGDEFVVTSKRYDDAVYVTEHDRPIRETEYIILNYREVKRWANVGETIRIVNKDDDDYENGAEFTVNYTDGDGDVRVTVNNHNRHLVLLSEYVVLEPVDGPAGPKRLTVGDYAKVIDGGVGHDYEVGSIVKIVQDDRDRAPYRAEKADGTSGGFLREVQLEPATEAEFLAQKPQIKVGDYVKVTESGTHFAKQGDILRVYEIVSYGLNPTRCEKLDGTHALRDHFFDHEIVLATEAEITAATREAKEALDPRNNFAKGDKVRLISGGDDWPLYGFKNGDIYEVTDPKSVVHNNERINIGGGFAKPEQLEKVNAEEIAEIERKAAETKKWSEIGRKVNEFKVGDLVQITANTNHSSNRVGDIGIVSSDLHEVTERSHQVRVAGRLNVDNWTKVYEMNLIVPVEQRFDKPEEAAA